MVFTFIILNVLALPSGYAYGRSLKLYDKGDFGCGFETERVQIGIALDVTNIRPIWNMEESFVTRGKEIVDALQALYKVKEFALITYANYDEQALVARHLLPEGCYMRNLSFTTNVSKIIEATKELYRIDKGSHKINDQNGLPAVAFAISDNKLGWIPEDIDKDGRIVHRIILLYSDAPSNFDELVRPGNRTQFRGDGTDTCSGSLPATRKQVGEILNKRGVMVIVVYGGGYGIEQYEKFFQEYGIPYKVKYFSNEIYVRGQIVEYLSGAVGEHIQCTFEDPPAYNTLGL